MQKTLFAFLGCSLALFAGAEEDLPRQFKVWGHKAPVRYGAKDPVPGARGIRSISIPRGFKRVMPDTNLQKPEIEQKYKDLGFLPFVFHPMRHTYDVTWPRTAEIDQPVRAIAAPGEYVPLTFAIRPLKELNCTEIRLAPFRNKKGETVIPLRNQDLRRVMDLPVTTKEKNQYVIKPKFLESFDEFDMLNMTPKATERFWLTVKVPEDAKPGIARSVITFSSRTGGTYRFQAAIRILPFKLAVPDPEKEMSFSMLSGTNDCRLSSWGRNTEPRQQLRYLTDMVEHGMNTNNYEHANPHISLDKNGKVVCDFNRPGSTCLYSMNDFLFNIKRAGFTGPFCNYNGPYEWASYVVQGVLKFQRYTPEYNQALETMARAMAENAKKMNWPEVIFVLADEPAGHPDRVKQCENLGKMLKKGAPSLRTTNFFNGGWFGVNDWRMMRSITDINCTNYATPETMKDAKACGYDRIWLYNGCKGWTSDTRGARLFYGFVPFRYQARGVSQFVYSAFDHHLPLTGNEFSAYDQLHSGSSAFYDFVYPAADGPLPTPQWESVRMGTYDYRYMLTLKKLIARAPKEAAQKAQAVLDEVNHLFFLDYMSPAGEKQIENYSPETLDACRWKIARAIMALQKAMR